MATVGVKGLNTKPSVQRAASPHHLHTTK